MLPSHHAACLAVQVALRKMLRQLFLQHEGGVQKVRGSSKFLHHCSWSYSFTGISSVALFILPLGWLEARILSSFACCSALVLSPASMMGSLLNICGSFTEASALCKYLMLVRFLALP